MIFWITAAALSLITAAFFAQALIRRTPQESSPAAYDLSVYRDQLKEVDRDLARGVISGDDAERMRTEISRRILTADAQLQSQGNPEAQNSSKSKLAAALLGLFVIGASGGLYAWLGTPGFRDMPLALRLDMIDAAMANRPTQEDMEARIPASPPIEVAEEFAQLMTQLRAAVADNPDDLQGQTLLVRNEANLGNLKAAYAAQERVISIKGGEVTADDFFLHANLMIAAAQEYISPKAEASLRAGLERDPQNLLGRYYYGLMMWQGGRPDVTFHTWDRVLRQSPPEAPWVAPIRGAIQDLAWYAGVEYVVPEPSGNGAPGLAGPTAEDVEAAQELTVEERLAMIEGMVAQLSDRLATEGGTAEEWAQLISAYGAMGDTARALVIWEEAKEVFADTPEDLEFIRARAARAGIME